MNKILIDFEMDSLDSKVKFTTLGKYSNQKITFKDQESNAHEIILNSDSVEYFKTGSMDMKFIFDLRNSTIGTYLVDENLFKFDISTTRLENSNNKLVIEYSLIQNNEIVNKSTLVIMYSITQEE